jgi:hypothetical protein
MKKCFPASLAIALILFAASHVWAAEPGTGYATIGPFDVLGNSRHHMDAGVGLFDCFNKLDKRSNAARIELRVGKKLAFVGPAVGVIANDEGGRYGYAGIYADFVYGKFVLTPLLAAGIYRQGNSIDLGGPFEFRESPEVSYRFTDRWRAGVSLAHISNASIYNSNPGQQDLLFIVAAGF